MVQKMPNEKKIAKREYYCKWLKKHPGYQQKYRETHREQIRKANRKYYKTHPEKKIANYEWHKAHPGYQRKWAKEHLEQNRNKRRKWVKTHPKQAYEIDCNWAKEHREQKRRYAIKHRYGITFEEHEQLLKGQNGVCAICGDIRGKRGLGVDHDHDTKQIRGLLCSKCNIGLGFFADNPEWLYKAANYCEKKKD